MSMQVDLWHQLTKITPIQRDWAAHTSILLCAWIYILGKKRPASGVSATELQMH